MTAEPSDQEQSKEPQRPMLAVAFDDSLPKDMQFAQVVVGAAKSFDLTPQEIRVTLNFLLERESNQT